MEVSGRPLGARTLPSLGQFPTIREGQHKEEAFFSSYKWNVLVSTQLRHTCRNQETTYDSRLARKQVMSQAKGISSSCEDLQSKVSLRE